MNHHLPAFVLAAAFACATATTAFAAETQATTPRGAVVKVQADHPAVGAGPFPAVVLAPGQSYHMGLPAMERLAQALVAQGVVVYRFNWAYFGAEPKGEPSKDLSTELEDLNTVLGLARNDVRVDANRIALGGKSLGSIVAWRAFVADRRLKAALLMTPVCSLVAGDSGTPVPNLQDNYPGTAGDDRPLAFVLGDQDPLCNLRVLYPHVASLQRATVRVGVVGGDHGFERKALGGAAAERALARNVQAAAQFGTSFLSDTLLP